MSTGRKGKLRNVKPELLAAARSSDWSKRPVCPVCGQRAPARELDWLMKWGHRDTSERPCPGWYKVARVAETVPYGKAPSRYADAQDQL